MVNEKTKRIRIALARSCVYKALAVLTDTPSEPLVEGLNAGTVCDGIAESVGCINKNDSSYQNTLSAIEELREAIEREGDSLSFQKMRDDHLQLFLLAYPIYETEYGYESIFQKTNAMADIAGFYRAFGVDLDPDSYERVDNVTTELEFMHLLTCKEAEALETDNAPGEETCLSARKKFLEEHLGRWISGFAEAFKKQHGPGVYSCIMILTASFVISEVKCLGLNPETVDFAVRCELEGDDKTLPPCTVEQNAQIKNRRKE